jgi:TnpA family transposase
LSRRPLLKANQWSALVDMPIDEESLIRHCTLGRAEMDLIQAKRTPHNRLGLAIQLCFLRHLGRAMLPGETPPAPMVAILAQQIGIDPGVSPPARGSPRGAIGTAHGDQGFPARAGIAPR